MNLENIKWIATDIDGTLKPYECEYISNSRDRFVQLVKKGACISIITGRPIHGALYYANLYGLTEQPIVACNGALIYHAGRIVYRQPMDIKALTNFIGDVDKLGASVLITTDNMEYCYRETEWIRSARKDRNPFPVWQNNLITSNIYKLAVMGHESQKLGNLVTALANTMHDMYEIVMYGNSGCEVTAHGADKANGLRNLAKYLNLKVTEIAAIGDNENDIAMLGVAGVGVAVANATTKVKLAADYVCRGISTSGVNEFIEKVLKIQRKI